MESLFDIRSLEGHYRRRAGCIAAVAGNLLASSRDDRTRLAELLELADLQGVAELAHRIKGAARVVGSSLLVESCSCLEKACQNPSESSGADSQSGLFIGRQTKCVRNQYLNRVGKALEIGLDRTFRRRSGPP
ncbi:Hpt domain-containing protein [Pseudomonas aeruginosa]|nr:Hpt domain-containing protein [Pseudomonas aeruginosa]